MSNSHESAIQSAAASAAPATTTPRFTAAIQILTRGFHSFANGVTAAARLTNRCADVMLNFIHNSSRITSSLFKTAAVVAAGFVAHGVDQTQYDGKLTKAVVEGTGKAIENASNIWHHKEDTTISATEFVKKHWKEGANVQSELPTPAAAGKAVDGQVQGR